MSSVFDVKFFWQVLAVTVLLWLTMRFSGGIHRLLRPSGVELLTRIAGLLLSAIAVQACGRRDPCFRNNGMTGRAA